MHYTTLCSQSLGRSRPVRTHPRHMNTHTLCT